MDIILNDLEQAQFLLDLDAFAFDIETDTEAPTVSWEGRDYGLSFSTNIIAVSFYAGKEHPPVVFLGKDNVKAAKDFFVELFTNRKAETLESKPWTTVKTVVGHNAVFDLRGLGGNFGFSLPVGVNVWDTLTMARRFMIAEKYGASLAALVKRFDLASEEELVFSEDMKTKRKTLHEVDEETVGQYVALDTVFTWRLYEKLSRIFDQMSMSGYALKHKEAPLAIPKWWELTLTNFEGGYNTWSLVEWEQVIGWWAANAAIRGVRLDTEYALKLYTEYIQKRHELEGELFSEADKSLAMPIWVDNILGAVKEGNTFKTHSKWVNFEYQPALMTEDNLDAWLSWSKKPNDKDKQAWYAWIVSLPPDVKRAQAVKTCPETAAFPYVDFRKILAKRFSDRPADEVPFLSDLTEKWAKYWFTLTSHPSPADILRKRVWKPYYLFVTAGCPVPTNNEIFFDMKLVSDTMNKLISSAYQVEDASFDMKKVAMEHNYFSVSTKAIEIMRKAHPEMNDRSDLMRQYLQYDAWINRIEEFLLHAEKDGRIHSLMARHTSTGRFKSAHMNLQNINMKDFRGFLIADDDDSVLVELDYANAENKLGAMVGGCDAFAMATESGDFHMNMAWQYYADEMRDALNRGDEAAMAKLRRIGKTITFGTAYGMGALKLARSVGTVETPVTLSNAEELLKRKDAAFPGVTRKKQESVDLINNRFRKGITPFIKVWSGARVRIFPYKDKNEQTQLPAYVGWNGAIQGGVGEATARSLVMATLWLLRNNYRTYIPLNIHDSLIVSTYKNEWEEAIPMICEIMGTVFPPEYLHRTIPSIHMVANVGPENFHKWGWRADREYLLPMDKFANQWGIFDMSEGEIEAPVWLADMRTNWTLEKEIEERKAINSVPYT